MSELNQIVGHPLGVETGQQLTLIGISAQPKHASLKSAYQSDYPGDRCNLRLPRPPSGSIYNSLEGLIELNKALYLWL